MKKLRANALFCLYSALMLSPAALLPGGLISGASQAASGAYYGAGQLLALLISLIPARRRVAALLAGGAAYVAGGIALLGALSNPMIFIIIALSLVAYLFTARMLPDENRYDSRIMIFGVALHIIAPIVITLSGVKLDYAPMFWAGAAFLLMCPFVMNGVSVREGMSLRGRGGKPLKALTRANRAWVAALLALALLIANAGALREAAERAAKFVAYWVGRFIMFLSGLFAGGDELSGEKSSGSSDAGLGLPTGEPSWFALLMEKIFKYVAIAILVVAVAFAVYKLVKLAIRLARRISEWAKRFAGGVKEDYMEEREQLMDWGEVRGEMLESVKAALRRMTAREKKWSELTPRERVRFAVRQLYKKRGGGITGLDCMSAREALSNMNLSDESRRYLSDVYDAARYSEHEITPEQAEQARRDAK